MEVLERLIGIVRRCCEGFPDPRRGDNGSYTMADFGLAAFSVFFAQSPSFLAHQRQLAAGHGRSNANTLFGMSRIPGDSHIRRMLDPVAPDHLFPGFDEVISDLERAGGLAAFQRLGSRVLIALDGTEYHRSTRVHCPHCSTRTRAGQPTEHFHTLLAATIVAPGHTHVVPLAPEFIGPQDGHDKQDCESRAVRRWLARHGPGLARLDPVYLGDDLYACQPVCEAVLAQGGHFLFVCKPSSHQTLQEYLTGIDLPEHVERVKRGKQRFTHRYRWLCDVPLRGDAEGLTVNWLQIEILDAAGAVTYRNSFVTDLPVDASSVAELAACGRVRAGAVEDRERELQRAQDRGLPPGAQLRPRDGAPVGAAGLPQSAGLCDPHRVRSGRGRMAQGSHDAWAAHALLPEPAGPDQLSGVLLLDRAAAHPGLRQAAPKPIGLSRPPKPSHPEPNRITPAQNPKRRTAGIGSGTGFRLGRTWNSPRPVRSGVNESPQGRATGGRTVRRRVASRRPAPGSVFLSR